VGFLEVGGKSKTALLSKGSRRGVTFISPRVSR
jgi:hypothetical protein